MSGWLKIGSASAIANRKKLLTQFAHNEQIYCGQKFAQ
jgi:hypothetical protein